MVGVFGAEVREGVGGGGIASEYDDIVGLVEVGFDGVFGESKDLGRTFGAVGGVDAVNDLNNFGVGGKFVAKMVSEDFAAGASVEDDDVGHVIYYTYV